MQHFRQNEECGATEELVTIDENLHYDFDYQVKYINTINFEVHMSHFLSILSKLPIYQRQ